MTKNLKKFLKSNITFTSTQARKKGIPPSVLAYYVNNGIIERISRGLYRNPKIENHVPAPWEDLVATAKSIPNGVVCLISALNLYEMTDEFAHEHWIAIPKSDWPKRRKHTKIIRMNNLSLGLTKIKLGDETIAIFDRERTIIDSFRLLSREIAIKALKKYLQPNDKYKTNFKKLNRNAKELHFDISPYVQALTV